jgi:hypothetical protein
MPASKASLPHLRSGLNGSSMPWLLFLANGRPFAPPSRRNPNSVQLPMASSSNPITPIPFYSKSGTSPTAGTSFIQDRSAFTSSEPPKSPVKLPRIFRSGGSVERMLHSLFEGTFQLIRIVNPKEDFGAEDLTHDRIRTFVAVATVESYVVHIDAHFYQMTNKWIDKTENRGI